MLKEMLDKQFITQEFYHWLIENGFKSAPASTKYHGAYKDGLYDHSCAVTYRLLDFEKLHWQLERSPYIIGMFHDLCKIDAYKEKLDDTGGYERNDKQMIKGHGDKSVMLLSQFMRLTEEEMLCIRYHMGAYIKEDWDGFDLAIKKYPNVLFTHTADMLASKLDI